MATIQKTTIELGSNLKDELTEMRAYTRETYHEVIMRLVESYKVVGAEPMNTLSDKTLKGIETALADIKAGRIYSSEEVKRRHKF